MNSLLVADQITHQVSDQVILKKMSLVIEAGDQFMITGPSGSGKTTLLHLLAGLDTPSLGSVRYQDRCYTVFSAHDRVQYRKNTIGFVFQFHHLMSGLSVKDNIMLASHFTQNSSEHDLRHLLDQLELSPKILHQPVNILSGGEKQRVALARALIHRPRILFADEPTGCLDQENARKMWSILQSLNQAGLTIVMVTHDDQLKAMGNKNAHLVDGVLASFTQS